MNNVTFTKEQKQQLKTNVLAIEQYIEQTVVPYLTGDVRIEFGGTHHDPRTGTPTAMYTLCVSKDKREYLSGWSVYKHSNVGLECKFGPAFVLEERYPSEQYDLLRNWQYLKQQLEQIVDKQRTIGAFIENFKV